MLKCFKPLKSWHHKLAVVVCVCPGSCVPHLISHWLTRKGSLRICCVLLGRCYGYGLAIDRTEWSCGLQGADILVGIANKHSLSHVLGSMTVVRADGFCRRRQGFFSNLWALSAENHGRGMPRCRKRELPEQRPWGRGWPWCLTSEAAVTEGKLAREGGMSDGLRGKWGRSRQL